jgi:formamidopyrimidine-DNA glycosylase
MPELAEVEFNRKQWDVGLRQRVRRVELQDGKRVWRGLDTRAMQSRIAGAVLVGSEARGKQMLFRFSGGSWLGLHLGMTGRLWVALRGYQPGRHDHLVLWQARQALVFTDPRQFGRVRFSRSDRPPAWWACLPPPVTGPEFTIGFLSAFLGRHRRLAIKGALMLQSGFPGIGNWMADEILWRCRLDPRTPAGHMDAQVLRRLRRVVRWVSRRALAVVGHDYSDLPAGWLFHERWSAGGVCPLHRTVLSRATVCGRTTAWCSACQSPGGSPRRRVRA